MPRFYPLIHRVGSSGAPALADRFNLQFVVPDTNAIPGEAIALNFGLSDSNVSPAEVYGLTLGVADSNLRPGDVFGVTLGAADTNTTPADAGTYAVNLSLSDSNVPPTESSTALRLPAPDYADTMAAASDSRSLDVRSWASGCTDNDAGKTTPANANGPPDGVFANVTTNLSVGDLANPVTLRTGSLNTPGGTLSNARLVLYFKVGTRASLLDTVVITFNDGAGHSGTAWTWGTAAEDYTTTPLVFTLPAGTALNALVVTASYTASVVASPQGALSVDALAVQVTTTL